MYQEDSMASTISVLAGKYNIDSFKQNFETGARAYLFEYSPTFPTGTGGFTTGLTSILGGGVSSIGDTNAMYLVKTAVLPSSSFEEILTPWQGFDYKSPGKRNYNNFTVTFNVDRYANIRKAFLAWQDLMLDPKTNSHALPSAVFKDQTIHLLGLDLTYILTYTLKHAWPMEVGDLQLDYSQTGDFATFDVTFSYTYFETK